MKANSTTNELDLLQSHVNALREVAVTDEEAASAQRALRHTLTAQREKRGLIPRLKWLAPAVAAAVVVGVLLVGGPLGPKPAFAQVQRYFYDFNTLYAKVNFEALGMAMWSMDVFVERGGPTRIDMNGDVSHIVDPRSGVMLTLDHQAQTFHTIDVPPQAADTPVEGLDWLHQIRDFQGQAERLPEQRTVRGVLANGFSLDSLIIWASADDNRPLSIEMTTGPGDSAVMNIDLNFDQPLAQVEFATSPPSGYRRADRE